MTNKIIIALDIDGCITSARTGWHIWDQSAVQFINWVCKQTGAKIVITSTWRFNHNKEFFEQFFGNNIHDDWKTADLKVNSQININLKHLLGRSIIRGDEVALWIRHHNEITDYLIVDDDNDFHPNQIKHFCQTDSMNGLLFEHMEFICDYFNIGPYNADAANKELQTR